MRMLMVAALAITASAALADEVDDAHRLAVSGRDSYWNCLAREYQRESNKGMSGPDFSVLRKYDAHGSLESSRQARWLNSAADIQI